MVIILLILWCKWDILIINYKNHTAPKLWLHTLRYLR